ncbi:hypothetical protein COB57_00815 [Candidatus Peregrinibacteria bacterium]|nr:MAG: hypothetical protein COB57_00815 [Candidatus Peregrinibacteria bacterium]
MSKHHTALAKIIQGIVSQEIFKRITPDEDFLTITSVRITKDFDFADVFISSFQKQDVVELLHPHMYGIQKVLYKTLQRKIIPTLRIMQDTSQSIFDNTKI